MTCFREDVLAGHVALITGGGTGICRGIAQAFVDHGASVCIAGRRQEVLDEAVAELGDAAIGVAADVRKPDEIAAAVRAAIDEFGELDTVVNGAAGNFLAPVAGLSPNGFRTVIDIDLCGTFNTTRAAFAALKSSANGLVLNISATLQYHGTPMQSHAASAKAGVDALTRNLAVEWGGFGIRANVIAPGPIGDTEGMRRLAPGDIGTQIKKHIPLGRFGTIKEIADTAVFLRSKSAAYITGAIIVVDGGQCISARSLGS